MEIISSYSRAQAITDGVLVEVTTTAARAGFTVPVAVTSTAWAAAIEWDAGAGQDEAGRLWDVLVMAHHTARRSVAATMGQGRCCFTVHRVPNAEGADEPEELDLTITIGPGDTAAPVITIGLPGED